MNDGLRSVDGLEAHGSGIQQLLQRWIRVDLGCVLGSGGVDGIEPRNRLIRLPLSPPLPYMLDGGATRIRRSGEHTLRHFAFAQRVGVVEQTERRDEVAL